MASAPGTADPNDEAAVSAILAHPRFPEAFRLLTRRFLALHQGPLVPKLMANEARYIVALFCMTLHGEQVEGDPASGLTLSRLVERCLAMRIMSRGRVEATVAVLERTGWLSEAPPGPDRRVRRLEPAAPMIADFRARNAFHLEALELVRPGRGYLALLAGNPGFFWALEAERGRLVAAMPSLRLRLPPLAALAQREGAYATMIALLGALERDSSAGVLPGGGEVSLPLATLATQLAMSRTQARRVLEELAAHRLVTLPAQGEGTLRVEPLAVQVMSRWYGIRLLRYDRNSALACARLLGTP